MSKENKEYSEGINLYGLLGWIVGINLLKFFGSSIVYDIIIFGIIIYLFYKSIKHMIEYKKYKHPIITMALSIVIILLTSVIRVIF